MNEATANKTSDVKIYGRLLSYVVPYWAAFLLSILGFLIYATSNVSFAGLVSYIVDSLQGNDPLLGSQFSSIRSFMGEGESLNRTIIPLAIVVIVICRGFGTFIGNYFISYVSTNLIHNLRCELFDQLLKLPSRFYDKAALGHLVAKVTFHVTQVTGAATSAVKIIIREGFTVVGYLAFLIYLNWKLTLIFFAVAPFIALLVNFAGKRFRRISERIQDSMGDVTHVAAEAVQGYRVVRTFGGTEYERGRFSKVSNYNRVQSMKMVVTSSISTPIVQLLVAFALAGLVWLVLDPRLLANMSPGNVVAFITTGGLLAKPIRQLSEVNATVQKGLAAAEDIFGLFDEEVEEDSGTVELAKVDGRIEFKNVSFSYGQDQREVLKDINFIANPGETIALVGRSGSGKSTLASLIPRFYSPSGGTILLDDKPIESLSLTGLRRHISIVTQQVTLFNDTIRGNIAYGALREIGEEAIVDAAIKAFAWNFISEFPDGLDTVVGDDGVLLSGGQRQRLAIARAFLKDSPVLILDEATSALDSESEGFIQTGLEAIAKGRTTFIIAHRLSTIEKADRILVIDDGRIVEQGTHTELLARRGYYAKFYSRNEKNEITPVSTIQADAAAELVAVPQVADDKHWFFEEFNPLPEAWYSDAKWVKLLRPLGFIYSQLGKIRRKRIERGTKSWKADIPVIVVGNINVGGTGKSPLVISLAKELSIRGLKPGIVSRGYGGAHRTYPLVVDALTDPRVAGDEPVMIARRTGCPVIVDPNRVRAVQKLLENEECDLVISDDGLQHYYLERDVEIAVIDGVKGLGNGMCMPAGPLRESPERLEDVDFVVVNGSEEIELTVPYQNMSLAPRNIINLESGESFPVDSGKPGPQVHGVAGIGNPQRFFDTLNALGFNVIEHPFPDHHKFKISDLLFGDSLPVMMTEKDAVKCRLLNPGLIHQDFWYLEVDAELPPNFVNSVISKAGLCVNLPPMIETDSVKV